MADSDRAQPANLAGVGGLRIMGDVGIKTHKLKHLRLHGKMLLADGVAAIVGLINLPPAVSTGGASWRSKCATTTRGAVAPGRAARLGALTPARSVGRRIAGRLRGSRRRAVRKYSGST